MTKPVERRKLVGALMVLLVALLIAGGALLQRRARPGAVVEDASPRPQARPAAAAARRTERSESQENRTRTETSRPDAEPAPVAPEVMADGIPIMPARDDAPRPYGPVHPHPITPQHRRLFRENALVSGLDDAVDARDAPALRRLLREYRDEYPEDEQQLQDGFELLAECLEHPGAAETRARAHRYWDQQRASTLRRHVRRVCLEPR